MTGHKEVIGVDPERAVLAVYAINTMTTCQASSAIPKSVRTGYLSSRYRFRKAKRMRAP